MEGVENGMVALLISVLSVDLLEAWTAGSDRLYVPERESMRD